MPLRVTVELIPNGDESRKKKVAVIDMTNDGTGSMTHGNYIVSGEGECFDGGEHVGWDTFFHGRITDIRRDRGHLHQAIETLKVVDEKTLRSNHG